MISQRRFERALEYIRRTGICDHFEAQLRPTTVGRSRQLRVDVLFAAALLSVEVHKSVREHEVTSILINSLSRQTQLVWDVRDRNGNLISESKVFYLWTRVFRLCGARKKGDPPLTAAQKRRCDANLARLLDALTGSAGMHIDLPTAFATDQTAIDSAARSRYSNDKIKAAIAHPDLYPNLRLPDPDARHGHRTMTHDRGTDKVFGYHMNALARTHKVGEEAGPRLIDRFRLVPADQRGISETIAMLAALQAEGNPVTEVIGDRAYSYTVAEDWAAPLQALGIQQVADIHENDRGPGSQTKLGFVLIDGWPHIPGIPEHLLDIPRPAYFSMFGTDTEEERAERAAAITAFHALIEERKIYRFERHGKTTNGSYRYISPARAGKVRCAGYPPSLHLQGVPNCEHLGDVIPRCCLQATVTVGRKTGLKLQQEHYWGDKKWVAAYNRRNTIERSFGTLKANEDFGVKRGWTRRMGLVKTSILLAIAVAAMNLKALLDWARRTNDTRDPLTQIDITNHGFLEVDADGHPLAGPGVPDPPER